MDVAHDPLDHALELRARHVRLKARRLAGGLEPAHPLAVRDWAVERTTDLGDARSGVRIPTLDRGVRVLHPRVHLNVREDRDGVLEMVEHHQHVGEHQRHVRQTHGIGCGLARSPRRRAERLDRAHQVVAEEAHGAA